MDKPTEEERLGFVESYGVEPVTDINTDLTFKDAAKTVAEFTPIIGDAIAAKEVYDELMKDEPNYGLIAALGGAALVGAVPGIGDAAAAGIRKAVDVAKRVEVDPDALGMMGGNIRIKPKTAANQPNIISFTEKRKEITEAKELQDTYDALNTDVKGIAKRKQKLVKEAEQVGIFGEYEVGATVQGRNKKGPLPFKIEGHSLDEVKLDSPSFKRLQDKADGNLTIIEKDGKYYIPKLITSNEKGQKGSSYLDLVKSNNYPIMGKLEVVDTPTDVWSYPKQLYDSADTSINVSKKPAGYNELKKRGEIKDGDVIVDIGGGRFDNLVEDAAEEGATVKVYDPFNRTPEHNAAVVDSVKDGQADMAMSHNVLNVIQEDKNIIDIAVQAENAIKPNGKAHFSVYEGTGKGEGKVTTKGYQRNQKTEAYIPLIEQIFGKGNVTRKGKIITATKNVQEFNEGGIAMEEQMAMNFGDVPDNTIGQDPVSGNDIPLGASAENVRDDIPANLSEGEIVVPADVVNFHGVKLFEDLRAEAKMGYAQMADDGRMGGEPMEMDEDDIGLEFADLEIMIMPDEAMEEEPVEMYRGGRSMRDYQTPAAKKSFAQAAKRNPSRNAQQTHDQIMASFRRDDDRPSRPSYTPAAISARVQARAEKPKNRFEAIQQQFAKLFRDDDSASEARAKRLERVRLESKPPTSDDAEGPSIAEQINFGGDYDKEYEVTPRREKRKKAPTIQEDRARQQEEQETYSVRYADKSFAERFMEGLGFDEGGMVEEPFYDQKGGFGELDYSGIQAREYMNDQGQKIVIMFQDGVPLTPIPEGYYPVAATVTPDVDSSYNVDTVRAMTGGGSYGGAAAPASSGRRDDPGGGDQSIRLNQASDLTPVNYKELSLEELRDMLEDQGSIKQKGILAAASAINPIMALAVRAAMWDTSRKTKAEIERRLGSGDTTEVDKMRYTNMLEIAEREKPSLLDRLTGKAFEKEYSQIPSPDIPAVDFSDPTLAPDQGIAEPYTPEVTTPVVADPDGITEDMIEQAKEASRIAAENAFGLGAGKQPEVETVPLVPGTGKTLDEITAPTPTQQIQQQRDRTRNAGSSARQTFEAFRNNPSNSKSVANNAAAVQRTDSVIRDMERGVQRGFEKGGLASKKKGRKKKSK